MFARFGKSLAGLSVAGAALGVVLVGAPSPVSAAVPADLDCLLVLCGDGDPLDIDLDLDVDVDLDLDLGGVAGGGQPAPAPPAPPAPTAVLGVDVNVVAGVAVPKVADVQATVPAQVAVSRSGPNATVSATSRPDASVVVLPDLGGPGGPALVGVGVDDLAADATVRLRPGTSADTFSLGGLLGGDLTCGHDLMVLHPSEVRCSGGALAGLDAGIVGVGAGVDVCQIHVVVLDRLEDAACASVGVDPRGPRTGGPTGEPVGGDTTAAGTTGGTGGGSVSGADGGPGGAGASDLQGIRTPSQSSGALPVTGTSVAILLTIAAAALAAGVALSMARRRGATTEPGELPMS